MKQFEANRLSTGNRLFPAKIIIDAQGVTLKVPGLFGGKERSFSFRDITSINLDTPMVGFSTVIIKTSSRDVIHAEGFTKSDAKEIKEMIMMGIANPPSTGGGYPSHGHYVPPQPQIETADQILAKAEAKRIDHEIELEKRKHADEQNKQFFDAAKKYWKIWTPILALLIIWMIFKSYQMDDTKQNSAELNIKLEQIEDKVKDAIDNGDKTLALELANQLIHPSNEIYTEKSGLLKTISYTEYWQGKRETYKEQIRGIGKNTDSKPETKTKQLNETPSETESIDNDVSEEIRDIDAFNGIVITDKVYFHTEADVNTVRKAYIVNGQQVEITKESDNFYYAVYTADNGNQTKGWVLKDNIEPTN